MDRSAVFVDAGYLFAQGSAALTGSQKPRATLQLNAPAVIEELRLVAQEKAPHCRLLRVYWYDGALGGSRPTAEQALIAHLDDVKLRLGFINSSGQQKGVDSLIVTDLIELARQKSICDAVLLSGDEDVRIGVQVAQNYGVRVHLLGIVPSRGSQSPHLLQEADTTTEWDKGRIASFLASRPPEPLVAATTATTTRQSGSGALDSVVQEVVQSLQDADLKALAAYWEGNRGVPPDFDRKLLSGGRKALARDLEKTEIRQVRSLFQNLVQAKIAGK